MSTLHNILEMAPHVARDHIIKHLRAKKLDIKRVESSRISDSEYFHVRIGDERDEYGEKIGDRTIKVRISDHKRRNTSHMAPHVDIHSHSDHSIRDGIRKILRHAGIRESLGDK